MVVAAGFAVTVDPVVAERPVAGVYTNVVAPEAVSTALCPVQ